jgi:hypothetical protein
VWKFQPSWSGVDFIKQFTPYTWHLRPSFLSSFTLIWHLAFVPCAQFFCIVSQISGVLYGLRPAPNFYEMHPWFTSISKPTANFFILKIDIQSLLRKTFAKDWTWRLILYICISVQMPIQFLLIELAELCGFFKESNNSRRNIHRAQLTLLTEISEFFSKTFTQFCNIKYNILLLMLSQNIICGCVIF